MKIINANVPNERHRVLMGKLHVGPLDLNEKEIIVKYYKSNEKSRMCMWHKVSFLRLLRQHNDNPC